MERYVPHIRLLNTLRHAASQELPPVPSAMFHLQSAPIMEAREAEALSHRPVKEVWDQVIGMH